MSAAHSIALPTDVLDTVPASTLTEEELSRLLDWSPRLPTPTHGQALTHSRRDLLLVAAANRWPNGIPVNELPESK